MEAPESEEMSVSYMYDYIRSVTYLAERQRPVLSEGHIEHRVDWSDTLAMKGARAVLSGIKYPDKETRLSLYASWLRIFSSSVWDDSFDGLMLDCVAATPSPTAPEKPLFASMYKIWNPIIDRIQPDVEGPLLDPHNIPRCFARKSEPIEPLPSSPGIVNYLADLIRKGCASQQALDEAGLIIGFCSIALAVVAAKPVWEVQDFFQTRMKMALTATVTTSYEGDSVFCPSEAFLTALASKARSTSGVVKPFLLILVLGQYAYNVGVEKDVPSADVRFLEEGHLKPAKYGQLEVVELLYRARDITGFSVDEINEILRENASSTCMAMSCSNIQAYLQMAEMPDQKTRPWCRTVNKSFFWALRLCENLDYAIRLTALLAPDPSDQLWQRPEFRDVSDQCLSEARSWARRLKFF